MKFSDIEYIFIPTYKEIKRVNRSENLASKFIENELEAIVALMNSLGLYEYKLNEKGLMINGYKSLNA